jgi:peptidoglycan/LPS O-acetylase OafA/YrhL
MQRDRRRNLQLDVLRGVAILLVFGRHIEIPRPGGAVGFLAEIWFTIGWLGVDLFFVLSGFLIGGLLVSELQKHGRIDVMRFLVRRGLKLYPGYFVFIAYLLLMPTGKALVSGGDAWASFAGMWSQYWPSLLFLQNYLGTPAGHLWSLAVEEHFYLLLPFGLAALAATGRIRWLINLCLMAVPVFLALRILSVWTDDRFAETMSASHLRLDALLVGVGIRAIAEYLPERFAAIRRWRTALVVTGVLLWLPHCFPELDLSVVRTVGLTATLLGAAAFLLAAYHTHAADFGRWTWLASAPASVVAWIGVHSYAIYLWHVTAFGILGREVGERVTAWGGGTTAAMWLASVTIMCAGAVLVGALASVVVEWPVLRVRDRLFPSRSRTLPAASDETMRADAPIAVSADPTAACRSDVEAVATTT